MFVECVIIYGFMVGRCLIIVDVDNCDVEMIGDSVVMMWFCE